MRPQAPKSPASKDRALRVRPARCGRALASAMVVALAGCGGAPAPEVGPRSDATSTQGSEVRRTVDPASGPQITGLMGTIRQDQVVGALEPRMNQFMRCLEPRLAEVEFLGGDVRLSFRIREDGSVLWVYPSATTLGDRAAERCVLEVASRARFPRPRGGEAEFSWGFSFDPPDDVRAPLAWEPSRVTSALTTGGAALRARCGRAGLRVTAYVAPGGRVLSAGASASDAESLAALDCVADGVRGWAMPDPGSYAAKVTFELR